tara:strand:- start:341 stop:718 length:378 start_codon:yes stop_codon:yes gene_type:complete
LKNFFLILSGIDIKKSVFVGDSVKFIDGYQSNQIKLNDRSVISPCTVLISTSYPYKSNLRFKKDFIKNEKIEIEEDVWVGSNCTILPGVKRKKNSTLGAGSVLTKNIESNQIWYGNPAKFIKIIS